MDNERLLTDEEMTDAVIGIPAPPERGIQDLLHSREAMRRVAEAQDAKTIRKLLKAIG